MSGAGNSVFPLIPNLKKYFVMKKLVAIAAASLIASFASAAMFAEGGNRLVAPQNSPGLKILATTGNPDQRAAEGYGRSFHHTGGSPVEFTYAIKTPWMDAAKEVLRDGEFLAPHFIWNNDGSITLMIAPHLFVDGKLLKGQGQPDNFVHITVDGVAYRYDYSETFETLAYLTPVAPSHGLHILATKGSGDELLKERGEGYSYHAIGGNPVRFEFDGNNHHNAPESLLRDGEFYAPHFYVTNNGTKYVMVAPHLFKDGTLLEGAGPDDNFVIVYPDGSAVRYDYSEEVAGMMDDMMMDEEMSMDDM